MPGLPLVQQPTGPVPGTNSGPPRQQPKYNPMQQHGPHPGSQPHPGPHQHRGNPAGQPTPQTMRPGMNNFGQYPRGMPHQGEMKGSPVGAQGPHAIPTGPPPSGAATGAPMAGFPPVGQMVGPSVQQITMAQQGQPNQRAAIAYSQFTYNPPGARPQQPYTTQAPGGRMPVIVHGAPGYRTFYPAVSAGHAQNYFFVPQAPPMLAAQQGGAMMTAQTAAAAYQQQQQQQQQPQQRGLQQRERKILQIKNPETNEEVHLDYRNKKSNSGPPQSAIGPATVPPVGPPAGPPAVLMNPSGIPPQIPPQNLVAVNPMVPPTQQQQQPPTQSTPQQTSPLVGSQHPPATSPPSITAAVQQQQASAPVPTGPGHVMPVPLAQQQRPAVPQGLPQTLLPSAVVPLQPKQQQPLSSGPPPAVVQTHQQQPQTQPQQQTPSVQPQQQQPTSPAVLGGYAAAAAAATSPPAPLLGGVVSSTNGGRPPTPSISAPTPAATDTASTQPLGSPTPGQVVTQPTQVTPDHSAKRETGDATQASSSSVSSTPSGEVRPGKVKGKPNLKMTSLANEQKRHAERNLSSPIPPVHGFNSQYTNGNYSGANNGSNEISTVPNGRHSYPKTDFEISIYNPKEKDVGRQGTPCEKNVTNNAHHNEVVIEYNFCTCNDKIDSSRCSSCNDTPCSPSGSAGTLNREQARNQRNRNNISVNASVSPTDPAEMESNEEAVNESSEVSESAATGDREQGSRSSLQREEDEERRKVEVKNEENLRKSQEAKELQNSQQLSEIEQSMPSSEVVGEEQTNVSLDCKGAAELKRSEKVTPAAVAATSHKNPSEDSTTSNDSGSASSKEEVVKNDTDDANSRQEDELELGEVVSDESDAELAEVDNHNDEYSPVPDNNGKKRYDREFLLKLQRQPMSMQPPKDMPKLEIFRSNAICHTLSDKPRGGPTGVVDQYGLRNGRGGAPGSSMNRNTKGAQTRAGERPKRIITLSSSINQDVKLHTAEKAWKPFKEVGIASGESDDLLYKKFRGILNKLTPQRFDTLLDQVKKLEINSEERLSNVAGLVLEKALNETHFASTYARLCHTLLTTFTVPKVQRDPGPAMNHTVTFRKMLLQKCQQEFEKDTDDSPASKEREKKEQEKRQSELDAAKNEQERKEIQEKYTEADAKAKRRTLGLMRFIGELYNLNILNFNIMSDCFRKLMKYPTDEDSIVCACKLFTTVGKKLADESTLRNGPQDTPELKEKHTLFQNLMLNLKKIISDNRDAQKNNQRSLPQRVIFMLEDVRELKERGWVPRRNEQAPKTLEQIQKDAENEKLLATINAGGPSAGGGGSRYSSIQSDRNRRSFGSQSQNASSPRGTDFKHTKQMMESVAFKGMTLSMSLQPTMSRPSGSQWVSGASGGGSRNSSLRGNRADDTPLVTSTNKFDLLNRDGSDHPARSQESSPSRQREREAALQGVRKIGLANATAGSSGNGRPGGARGSAPASRNASQGGGLSGGQPGAVGEGTHSLQGTESNDDNVRRYAETILLEYATNGNREDMLKDFCERAHANNVHRFIEYFIEMSIEAKTLQRVRAGEAIRELHDAHIVSQKHIENALKEQLSMAEDMVIDIPKYYECMAEIMAPLFVADGMNFSALLRAVKAALVPLNTSKMLVSLFKRINEISSDGVSKKWKESGINLSELVNGLPEIEIKAIEAALGQVASISPGLGLTLQELCQRFRSALDTSKSAGDLEHALKDVVHQAGKEQRKLAVQAFATVLLNIGLLLKENSSTSGKEFVMDLKLIEQKLHVDAAGKNMPKPIEDLFNDDEASIQALYALQIVMHEREHPKEATSNFINWLYDKDLVSEDVIKDWAKPDRTRHEQTGYHVTVQNASGFLSWLGED
ncbi:eukaryotic translation initiation factor 4 gamma 1-like isoform X2 [Varroa jacobsoni]|uniref:eukaryotic translation initiation factor 4 gamma 1-like isoform X2 n=1 Tax=Varroa jacobsoni TaxID=62625 RepID=UPI000BF6E71B|nr:eukaryotic translation initiation factor 4 gamma 1-like isoform X2 [Varroa jacobsoni]